MIRPHSVSCAFISLLLTAEVAIASPIGIIDLRATDFSGREALQQNLRKEIVEQPELSDLPPPLRFALLGSCSAQAIPFQKLESAGNAQSAGMFNEALSLALDAEVLLVNQGLCGQTAPKLMESALRIQREAAAKAGRSGVARRANSRLAKITGTKDSFWWSRYPEVDAVGQPQLLLPRENSPPHVQLWVDGKRISVSKSGASGGEIVSATAKGYLPSSVRLDTKPTQFSLEKDEYEQVRKTVRSLRGAAINARLVQKVLLAAKIDRAIVLTKSGGLTVWVRGRTAARKAGTAATPSAAISLAARQTMAKISPSLLLGANTAPIEKKKTRWWVYASAFGAAAIATVFVVAGGFSNDKQQITIDFPSR